MSIFLLSSTGLRWLKRTIVIRKASLKAIIDFSIMVIKKQSFNLESEI